MTKTNDIVFPEQTVNRKIVVKDFKAGYYYLGWHMFVAGDIIGIETYKSRCIAKQDPLVFETRHASQ